VPQDYVQWEWKYRSADVVKLSFNTKESQSSIGSSGKVWEMRKEDREHDPPYGEKP
jgi:hypothetical protein